MVAVVVVVDFCPIFAYRNVNSVFFILSNWERCVNIVEKRHSYSTCFWSVIAKLFRKRAIVPS